MEIKFSNNASTLLLDNILDTTTAFSILPDTGALFPILEQPTDYFKITVTNPGDGSYEIMKVTATTGDLFTVVRAQEGTIALPFPQNSVIENRLTAGSIEHILNDVAATTTEAGRIRIATQSEVKAGVISNAALTPAFSTALYIPVGAVISYAGQYDASGFVIDAATSVTRNDWHICDGTNGTPDLRDKFILGASATHALHNTGGTDKYTPVVTVKDTTLTLEQIPAHNHRVWQDCGVSGGGNVSSADEFHGPGGRYTSTEGGGKAHTHEATVAEMTIMQPYYALTYIMKIN